MLNKNKIVKLFYLFNYTCNYLRQNIYTIQLFQLTGHILCLYIIMKIIFLKIRKSIVNSLITQLYLNVCAVFLCTFTHSKRLRCVKIHSCTAWWSCGGSNATTWMGFWVIQLLPQCTLVFFFGTVARYYQVQNLYLPSHLFLIFVFGLNLVHAENIFFL